MTTRPAAAPLRSLLMLALATTVLLSPAMARADSVAETDGATRARLKALFSSGKAHYNLGEFREALEDFKAAYRITPDPVFLFNIAQTQRELGDHEAALRSFRLYQREVRSPRDRADAERLAVEEERAIAARRAAAAAAAVAPPPAPAPTQPLPAAPATARAPSASASAAPATSSSSDGRSRRATWIALGVAGGLLVAGGAVTLGVLLSRPSPPDAPFGTYGADFR